MDDMDPRDKVKTAFPTSLSKVERTTLIKTARQDPLVLQALCRVAEGEALAASARGASTVQSAGSPLD